MLPKQHRFDRRKEISCVFQKSKRSYSPLATIYFLENTKRLDQPWRLAVIVGKTSVSKLATHRNLAKRQILNAFYQISQTIKLEGVDMVIVAKKRVLDVSFEQLQAELRQLLKQC